MGGLVVVRVTSPLVFGLGGPWRYVPFLPDLPQWRGHALRVRMASAEGPEQEEEADKDDDAYYCGADYL